MRTKAEILNGMNEIEFLSRGYNDFNFFVSRVFDIHLEQELLTLVDELEKHNRVAVMAFTGCGKTITLGELYPLWKMFYNYGFSTLIISNSMDQSTKLLRRIKDRMLDNEMTASLVPKIKDKWSETEIVTSNHCNLFCKPLTPNVKGVHVNYLLADEVAEYKDENLFKGAVLTRITAKENTKMAAISTPISEADMIHKLMENPAFTPIVIKAEKMVNGVITPTCPIRFPLEKLRIGRDSVLNMIGKYAYGREYLCDCTSVGDKSVFNIKKIVEGFDKKLNFSMEREEDSIIFTGADFAMSARGDYFVEVSVELKNNRVIIKDIQRYKGMTTDNQEGVLVEINNILKPNMVVIDATNIGAIMKEHLIHLGLPVMEQGFTARERLDLLNNLRRIIDNGQLVIPRGEEAQPLTDLLFNELSSFMEAKTPVGMLTYKATTSHDDLVMATAMACKLVTSTLLDMKDEKENEEIKLGSSVNNVIKPTDMWIC